MAMSPAPTNTCGGPGGSGFGGGGVGSPGGVVPGGGVGPVAEFPPPHLMAVRHRHTVIALAVSRALSNGERRIGRKNNLEPHDDGQLQTSLGESRDRTRVERRQQCADVLVEIGDVQYVERFA